MWDCQLPGEVQLSESRCMEVIILNDVLLQPQRSHQDQLAVNKSLSSFSERLHSVKVSVLEEACEALVYVTQCPFHQQGEHNRGPIEALVQANLCSRIVELLLHESEYVWRQAFKLVWNITNGTDCHKKSIVNCGLLPVLLQWLTRPKVQGQQTGHDNVLLMVSSIVENLVLACDTVIRVGLVDELIAGGLVSNIAQLPSLLAREDGMLCAGHVVNISLGNGSLRQVEALIDQASVEVISKHLHVKKTTADDLVIDAAKAKSRIADIGRRRRYVINMVAMQFLERSIGNVIADFDALCVAANFVMKVRSPKLVKPAAPTGRSGGA